MDFGLNKGSVHLALALFKGQLHLGLSVKPFDLDGTISGKNDFFMGFNKTK